MKTKPKTKVPAYKKMSPSQAGKKGVITKQLRTIMRGKAKKDNF